ncbi:MAG: iron-containing redox enzyme family protein [Acidimicrobiales bacterium]
MVSIASDTQEAIAPSVRMPRPRGPVSEQLLHSVRQPPHDLAWHVETAGADQDDLHLALYCCYELHYRGLPAVDPEWEWEPSLLAVRRRLEACFLAELESMVGPVEADSETVTTRLWEMADGGGGPSLSGWVAARATLDQVRELAVHRSAYQLKEADPHTWGIPRLAGAAKAAMVTIQADEYGGGVAGSMHATLFARTMAALELDPSPNLYLDLIPGITLATTNLISMLGLHRRWRGALVGHLALFEMTSVRPMARYGHALRRLGVPDAGCQFYDVHVDADQIHQHLAADGMVGGLLHDEPHLARDVLFGAAALGAVEARFSRHVLDQWRAGRSSLRPADGPPPDRRRRSYSATHAGPFRTAAVRSTEPLAG